MDPLADFSGVVREWFTTSFAAPTPPQAAGWPAIARGDNTLICAPTGSGKTLTAFLWGLDRLVSDPTPEASRRTRVLYISPLRALAVDVEKNLRAPLRGIQLAAERHAIDVNEPRIGVRTGDTPADERQRLVRHPPDLLITTPESLYLMLTSRARSTLGGVRWVIIDEIHALASTKRGSHLAVSLERLADLADQPLQRIGLSATQRPLDEVARFLGGYASGAPRPVTIIDEGSRKQLEVEVIVPVDDMTELGSRDEGSGETPRRSIWPAIHPRLLELILEHRSTLVFCNSRRLAERLATRLNELYHSDENRAGENDGRSTPEGAELVRAHHGSLSREQRLVIEDDLKAGRVRALVATSSLELGIDMGAVDLVVQVESPGAVSRGLQRIGRAGHQVGEPSRGRIFPKHRGDLLEAAVVVRRMLDGEIEHMRYPRNPLDVLAQQLVAMVSVEEWSIDELLALIRRAAPFAELSDEVFASVLDLLAGRYPSDEFSGLRPRLVWDRVAGKLRGREGAGRVAVTNAGTIPDRGLYGVFLPDGKRVGELDEEMVYESRVGETFLLGATTWRIEDIAMDRVIVTPAPGAPGRMPFWHGDKPGRPLELGRAVGAFSRHLIELDRDTALALLTAEHGLDARAASNLWDYLDEQRRTTGTVPDDRTIVVERFRDEIGDWRVCVLSPFGAQVHAPWGMALRARLEERFDAPVELLWSDDGIVVRLPEAVDHLPLDELALDPEEIDDAVMAVLPDTAMFAARFREVAGRALLLPRRRPGQRTPLWQQRQRAADLLRVAARYPSFPMLLETVRECIQEVFDLPALTELLGELRSRRVRLVSVETDSPSPFAQSLMFGWIAAYMYEGDAPLAERRAAALALDRGLLDDLLGAEELRELLDGQVLAELELELAGLAEDRRARTGDDLADLLRRLGDLDLAELDARCDSDPEPLLAELAAQRRAIQIHVAGQPRWVAAEDAARYRDALGCALPVGLPAAFTEPVEAPLDDLVARYARTHGPFGAVEVARRLGAAPERIEAALAGLRQQGRVVVGEFRPGGVGREWCDAEVLRRLRRRSLARLRDEVEPVDQLAFARFALAWQGADGARRGPDTLLDALDQLQGAPLVASALESDVLPVRVPGYRGADLDALFASGELVWTGAGALGSSDGRLRLAFRDQAPLILPLADETEPPDDALHHRIREHLGSRGASFWPDLVGATGVAEPSRLLAALWDLVWAGEVTNDTLAPLRALVNGSRDRSRSRRSSRRPRPRPGALTRTGPPTGAGRWSLVGPVLEPRPTSTELAHARALQLLERHGVLTREAVLAEGAEGGFAGVYGILSILEERGQLRRGYFVDGLGAAQFALPGAVDRLRSRRRGDETDSAPRVLAATDPAQPYGAALPWPPTEGRATRRAGAQLVMAEGRPLVLVDRGGRSLSTFPGAAEDPRWIGALAAAVAEGRIARLEARRIDGVDWTESPLVPVLIEGGFQQGYKGPILRS